jgi:hypothetical protein
VTRRTLRAAAALAMAALAASCSLTEVTTAPGDDVLFVEGVLRTDLPIQQVLLAHTLAGTVARGEPDARVTVTGPAGDVHVFSRGSQRCFSVESVYVTGDSLDFNGTCYRSTDEGWLRPGAVYDLRVETTDGRVVRGRTRVPASFAIPSLPPPAPQTTASVCSLAPDSAFTLLWTASDSAYGYVADAQILGLSKSLSGHGFDVPDPLELQGFSVSRTDTTLVVPTELGVFDRFLYNDQLLLAIRNGFPEGTQVDLVLAAVDRNWVNSARGGNFNPSGEVHVSTVVGDGVGVFAAINARRAVVVVQRQSQYPRCGLR